MTGDDGDDCCWRVILPLFLVLINAEIADIERSLSEMSTFAAARRQARPITAAPRFLSAAEDLPSEWKRTVPSYEAEFPSAATSTGAGSVSSSSIVSPTRVAGGLRPPASSFTLHHGIGSSSSAISHSPRASGSVNATADGDGVLRLTLQFNELAKEVNSFISAARTAKNEE